MWNQALMVSQFTRINSTSAAKLADLAANVHNKELL
jgi:hypothetical protein